jgi:hypothetical protein
VKAQAAIAAMLLLVALPAKPSDLSDCGLMHSDCRKMLGKRLWIAVPTSNPNSVELTTVRGNWANTEKFKTGSFVINGTFDDEFSSHDFWVTMQDGRKGYISADGWIFLLDKDPAVEAKKAADARAAAADECARRGQPKIGMTTAELVETCWLRPVRIVKRTPASGIEESYIYTIGHIVEFTDGKITEIVESR